MFKKKKSGKSKKPQNVCLKHNEFSTSVTWIRNKNKTTTKKKNYEKSERRKKLTKYSSNKQWQKAFLKYTMSLDEKKLHCLFNDL